MVGSNEQDGSREITREDPLALLADTTPQLDGFDHKRLPREQLQAALNLIPAFAWYCKASGGLTFLNERG